MEGVLLQLIDAETQVRNGPEPSLLQSASFVYLFICLLVVCLFGTRVLDLNLWKKGIVCRLQCSDLSLGNVLALSYDGRLMK